MEDLNLFWIFKNALCELLGEKGPSDLDQGVNTLKWDFKINHDRNANKKHSSLLEIIMTQSVT